MSRRRVCYFHDSDLETSYFGPGHPMKPARLMLTHHLVLGYGLHRRMEMRRPHRATSAEVGQYHSDDYVRFLERVSGAPDGNHQDSQRFNVGEFTDCPVFDGLFDYCRLYTGGSLDGAARLNHGLADVCVNWSGGLHHAKKSEASGFCYVNDIVLAILELLRYHPRVLYIDIDIHHGDGVEEAFYTTDRVMTCSFHKFGDFFPGTGDLKDVGSADGKYYTVNFPLKEGIGDDDFLRIFRPVIAKIMETYDPSAVVLQCGADSLTGDRLGCFNLTVKGHAEAVKYVRSFNRALLVLGGGGYTICNVARCWAYETAVILGVENEITGEVPENDYFEFFAPSYELHLTPSSAPNLNTPEYLEKYKKQILENLSQLEAAPGVQMQEIPPSFLLAEPDDEDDMES